ncbi:LptA/OstA family protein [Thalassospira sp. MCCC 1A01428]|uniref:LptA/OstA family protein n=1 Tax=Thalassospira sp. MCCC 1A01428 TaxID=1470575 RepID=UPI000A1DE718|nr:LptA/OstA family protein [Thalassospira sp. MCCC 1A01428]
MIRTPRGGGVLFAATLVVGLACGAGISPVHAASLGLTQQGAGGLDVESDNGIEWRRNDNVLIARGNAFARRGDSQVNSDELRAFYREADTGTEIYRLEAHGHVKLSTSTDVATGDLAIYDIDQAVVVLTGKNLKYKTPTETLTAKDSLEYWEAKHMAVARGNAVAISEGRQLSADVLSARFVQSAKGDNELERIDGYGHVTIETATDFVVGDQGVYDAKTGIATLTGSVKITRGKNQLNGDRAVVDLKTGISRLMADGKGDGKSRVRGLLVPDKEKKPEAAAKPAGKTN